jgi:prephenate dehydrogenase
MIGIVGFGRFGALMARYLARDFSVGVYNRSDKSDAIRAIGARPVSLEEACGRRLVILSVPISRMRDTLSRAAPLLRPDALVCDVASVKTYPVRWMRELLPESVSLLPTHPMFGPDSAAESLLDRKIVLCRERISDARFRAARRYLTAKGLIVVETTPEEHDRQIAVSLSLTHFIGRGLAEYGAKELIIDTEGYKRLLHILGVVTHDTWQLFEDMNRFNPFAAEHRRDFLSALSEIDARLRRDGEERRD